MAQQQLYSWYLDLGSGEAKSQMYATKLGHRAWLTDAVLVDPASAAAGKSVRVALRPKTSEDQICLVLSAELTVAALRCAVMLDDDFWLERQDDDCPDAVVQFRGVFVNVLATPETEMVDEEEDGEDQEAGFGELDSDDRETAGPEDDEEEEIVEYVLTEPDDNEDSEDDNGDGEEEEEQENDGEFEVSAAEIEDLLQLVHPSNSKFVAEARFLRASAPCVNAAGNTAGFMRVRAQEFQEGDNCDKEIFVLYRYNCFSTASFVGGVDEVEVCGIERRVHLRFIATGQWASSLEWAGASMASLIYPGHSSYLLRELWSRLIADVNIPVLASRIEVFVHVGILRPVDCTPERIGQMISALEDMMEKPWYGSYHAELHLPDPVRCVTEDEANYDEKRSSKPRKVVAAGQNCVVCLELLEGDDLVAWPGCGKPHVFHAACLKCVLEMNNTTCPICRRCLYIEPKFYLQE